MHYSLFKRTIAAKRNEMPLLYSQEKKQELKSNAYEKIRLYKTQGDKSYVFWEKDLKKAPGNKHLTSGGIYYSVIFLFQQQIIALYNEPKVRCL